MNVCTRPTPWEVVCAFDQWKGDRADLTDLIWTDDINVIYGPQTSDGLHRVELSPRLAMTNRKAYGYIAAIHEADCWALF